MKRSCKPLIVNLCIAAIAVMSSCKKEASVSSTDTTAATQAAVTATQAVAVTSTSHGDSVYVIGTCPERGHRDSIAVSALPTSVTSYLSGNYAGYTVNKAFKVSDASGTLQGYTVIITYNGNPVGLRFDASGNFVKVLEQREGHDLLGRGFHEGGCFDHRNGLQRDTVALTALPSSITSYFSANYASDTLLRAARTADSGYVVLSNNAGLYATVFNASGSFVSRVELPAPHGKITAVDAAALPAAVTNYLTTTYPGYVFNKAFSISVNGTVQGYCVAIEANSTRYVVFFDASGNFVAAKTIH